MSDTDLAQSLAQRVRDAAAHKSPLSIRGGGSKRRYTGQPSGTPLDVTGHRGIVSYEPTELVITARAGTPLAEIEAALSAHHQLLGFEPPHFGKEATLGGTIACGFSGPRRPYAGSARDFVLGTRLINGKGEVLKFGGQVMKNVAGYDISRLMAGSLGTLGVLLEISLKVLPRPATEITLAYEMDTDRAIHQMNQWAGLPLPLSAAAHSGETLHVRLSGSAAGVRAARAKLGGELLEKGATFWEELREHRQDFFQTRRPLWRLSVAPATPMLDLPGQWVLDWGGAQRWLVSDAPDSIIHRAAQQQDGYATPAGGEGGVVQARALLPARLRALHTALRTAFDPAGVMNTAVVV